MVCDVKGQQLSKSHFVFCKAALDKFKGFMND